MLAYLDTLIGFAVVMLGASLIITILTQMVSALLSHRGANLKWGIENLFKHLPSCPLLNTAEHAAMVAKDVLTHPLISDSIFSMKLPIPIPEWFAERFKLATAIDPDELVAILKDLATRPAYQAIAGLPAELDALVSAQNPAVDRRLALLTTAPALANLHLDQAVPLLHETVRAVQDEAGKLEAWFNATMDRVSQRFTTYVRLWTVGFGVALAIITGLNTVTLLNRIYTNGDFRQQLVGAAPEVRDLTNKVLPEGSKPVLTQMYTAALAKALTDAKSSVTPATDIASDSAARDWIKANITDAAQQTAVTAAYNKEIEATLNQGVQNAAAVRNILTKASFDISQFGWDPKQPVLPQIPGVLATAALLSLGAPFWFNILKQATNLRPVLAKKQDTE
ncbi:MAG TPA: hypothetical protein VMH28_09325 [Candidatus Acidoferrales bacterium]|nr:hypothetical protein [Candidatus Acidoferrales bacterium]